MLKGDTVSARVLSPSTSSQAHQYARADYAAQSQQANNVRRRLRYFIESLLFTFVPASLAQLGFFIAVLVQLFPPSYSSLQWESARDYMRLFVCVFGVYFGLLAIWWSYIRTRESSTHTPTSTQSRAQPIVKSAADMSLIDWALGPIELEAKASATRCYQHSNPEKEAESPVELE